MKKVILTLITILILNVLTLNMTFASTPMINASVSSNTQELKSTEQVIVTLKLDKYNGIKKGVNAYKATLVYDDTVFEEVILKDFTCQNNWEMLKYNKETGELVAIKKAGSKKAEAVVKIALKVKKNAPYGKTIIKIKDIVTSEGKEDLFIDDKNIAIHIVGEQTSIDNNTGNNSNNNNSNTNSNPSNSTINSKWEIIKETNNKPINNENQVDNSKEEQEEKISESEEKELEVVEDYKDPKSTKKIKNTKKSYFWAFVVVGLEVLALFIFVFTNRKKDDDEDDDDDDENDENNNAKKAMMYVVIGLVAIQFLGTSYALKYDFSKKGELNGDKVVDYSDAELLELHLINTKKLPNEKLENADINSDGKITVTDLTLLVQKLENILDYEVTLSDLKSENYYPHKNEEITLKWAGIVDYDAQIEKVVINNEEYSVIKSTNDDNEYSVKVNTKNIAGIKEYKFSEVLLNNGKRVKIDYSIEVDVLKDKPIFDNYTVEEDINNSKLNLSYNLTDNDNSITSTEIVITNDNNEIIQQEEIKKGKNKIEVKVEEGKIYNAKIMIVYDLASNKLDQEEIYKDTIVYEKQLQLTINYNFSLQNIRTLLAGVNTTSFEKNQPFQIAFESINSTIHEPSTIKVAGKVYNVEKQGTTFIANIDGIKELGNKELNIEEVVLSNGKKFILSDNNTVRVNIIKTTPTVTGMTLSEDIEKNNIKAQFNLNDLDHALTAVDIVLYDALGKEIDRKTLSEEELKIGGQISKDLSTKITSKYTVKIVANYNKTGEEKDNVLNSILLSQDITAKPRATIKSVTVDKKYSEKNDNVLLTYIIESNKTENISKIRVNDTDCTATKLENGNYQISFTLDGNSGLHELTTTKLIYSDNTEAKAEKTVKVDVLRDKPTIKNFIQKDNLTESIVTLEFDVLDKDDSFISGKAVLTNGLVSISKDLKEGKNSISFEVENAKEYNLELKVTYDRDSNSFTGEENENLITDETLSTHIIQLLTDYEVKVEDIKTYNQSNLSTYFSKNDPIIIDFTSSNLSTFEPVKAVINGKEYQLTKNQDRYKTEITGYDKAGVKDIKIEKVTLSNTKEVEIKNNNKTKVEILKDQPKIVNFQYQETADGMISITFDLNDPDQALESGNIVITNNSILLQNAALKSGENKLSFMPKSEEEYSIKISANYDLDTNELGTGINEYKNITLYESELNIGNRQLEVKDITSATVYKQTDNGVVEITNLKVGDLENLNNYIVKVKSKKMPTFYTTIKEYRVDKNKLKLTLNYDNVTQYLGDTKQNKLEVDYGTIKNGTAENISFESLVKSIEENPSGNFELSGDVDASGFAGGSANSVITEKFTGTLNGNGYKIYNLTKPLFNEVESAKIENLVLSDVTLSGANSKGSIANIATDTKITNVHIKGLNYTTGDDHSAGIIGDAINTNIEKSSVTDFNIITSGHIRISAIVGRLTDGTIKNCYVTGKITSTQSKDGNGIGGVLGHGFGDISIENCISKIEITNNVGHRLNGAIVGILANKNSTLKNNVSLSTGTNFYSIHGNEPASVSTNNYELKDSGLTSNKADNRVISISKEDINSNFYKNNAQFDENIWNLTNTSYDKLPLLKNSDPNITNDKISGNSNLYIPDYTRIKKIHGYSESKNILYHNLNKLMPYYDAKYLIEDGAKISNDNILATKAIRYIMPYSNGKLLTYLTSDNYNTITDIKVVFDDLKISNYKVNFEELNQNISIYKLDGLDIYYAPNNYIIKNDSSIINTIKTYIEGIDYAKVLDPLTSASDARHYRDHYNEVIKLSALNIALQILQNDEESILTINNEILNNKIKEQLIDGGKLNRIIYAYNYYYRWYNFEIGGAKVSDILLFESKMFNDKSTLDNLVNEVFVGNIGVNVTDGFFKSNISKYTGSSELKYFLDYIIQNIGGYNDVNDWFTEYFGARNILAEFGIDNRPDILYRGWYQLKKNSRMILPVITMPIDSTYMISGPAQLQFGPSQLYHQHPNTDAGRKQVKNIVNAHLNKVKRHFTTLAGSFDSGKWNNYCIMVYDCTRVITGYKTTYIPGTNIPIGTSPVYTAQKVGTNNPFCKNFSEVLGLWQPAGSSAGVGNTAGFLWFQATPGLTNFDTWTHEFEHALYDKIMLFQRGCRLQLETLTEGNVEQRVKWSENNLVQDVGPYYFNTTFDLNKEGNATQNLTPERIDTKEKLENYFKGQQNALDLLDYIEGKAFIKLTPEQQSKIATRMSLSSGWTSWRTINATQAEQMNLNSLEALYDNRIVLRPNNAWGVSVRGLNVINGIGQNDYGFESVWVNRWYLGHIDNGSPDAFSAKRNFFEMLGYAGVEGYVIYGSRASKNDLDAIKKITKMVTGTEMDWKQYKMSRYKTVEDHINNKYLDINYLIERYTEALRNDADKGDRNISQRTALRKVLYHYLKSVTNDFVADPLGSDIEMTHIKTAQELVEKINKQPYGYYILDNDIDFSQMTTNVTQTFMGILDGNGHKIIGNKLPIFQKIRYGSVKNLVIENTNIPTNISNVGVLSARTEYSVLKDISAKNIQLNFGGRSEINLIGGTTSTLIYNNCQAEALKEKITSAADFNKISQNPGGIFVIENDIDFTGYNATNSVITVPFTGKIEGKEHTISNLTNASLFDKFNGTVEGLNIKNFSNISTGDNVTAFAHTTSNATIKNMKFENITLNGRHRVAVVVGHDDANSNFENISVKNASVKGTGVYISTFIGRKYGGSIKNVFVQGSIEITTTENGGVIGAFQKGGTMENVIANVNINKTKNTYTSSIENSVRNGGAIGNIYDKPKIKNVLSLGEMKGFLDNSGNELIPYKLTGAITSMIVATMENCYEVTGVKGTSSVTAETAGKLNTVSKQQLHNTSFYKDTLQFDEKVWDFTKVATQGYPELR